MKVLTYASHKKHYELYTEIHDLITANRIQIELARKSTILLSDIAVILIKAGSRMGVAYRHINMILM